MKIQAISISAVKGTKKKNVDSAELHADYGIIGDAHAGSEKRQVSFLSVEAINDFCKYGVAVAPGDFAENIATSGMDYSGLRVGDILKLGRDAVLEVSQIGKTCHHGCDIAQKVGFCIMPTQGVFARVVKGGQIKVGDTIVIADLAEKQI